MRELLAGAITAAAAVAALYFLKFWRRSHDRLFALFAAAFALLAVNGIAVGLTHSGGEFEVAIYLVRLAAFVLILVAIIDKNRGT